MGLENLSKIRALVSDVDGVLTSGSIFVGESGETKVFNVRDGMGIKLFQGVGYPFALLSGRRSAPLAARAHELGIEVVKTGRLDKQRALEEIRAELKISMEAIAYIGDDIPDLAPLTMAAVGFCPMDAVEEVKAVADHIVPLPGGLGVVRHVVEMVLKAQGLWRGCVARFEVKSD